MKKTQHEITDGAWGRLLMAMPFVVLMLLAAWAVPDAMGQDQGEFEWVPAAAHGEEMSASFKADQAGLPVVFTQLPRPTADVAKFTEKVVLDLEKYKISNNGKDAKATSAGLNKALQDAKAAKANYIVFPEGTYLIDPDNPIILDHKNTIIDLNGAILQMEQNDHAKYSIVNVVFGAENLRLTNGTIRGEYGPHKGEGLEGNSGLIIESGLGLEFDQLTVTNIPGFAIQSLKGMDGLVERGYIGVGAQHLESGAFSDDGQKVVSTTQIRTINPFEFSDSFDGEFEFGYIFGYGSYQSIKDRNYQACFYDKNMKFLAKMQLLQYKKTAIPENAKYIHLEFNQPSAQDVVPAQGLVGSLSNLRAPVDVHFHHNNVSGNRGLGLAFCGGQRWIIENNRFDKNGGIAPGFGVDFEDGWDLMQDVVFRHNTFKDNLRGDLVVCAGSEMIFDDNAFEKSVVFWGRTHNYTFSNNTVTGGDTAFLTRTGVISIHHNSYKNCGLSIQFDNKGYNDGFLRKPGETPRTPPVTLSDEVLDNVTVTRSSYLSFVNCKISNSRFFAGEYTALVRFSHCALSESSLEYEKEGPEIWVNFDNCDGTLKESGPGLARKRKE